MKTLKLNLKPGGPITQVPLSWFLEVTAAVNALYSMHGAGTVNVVVPNVPSEKNPIVIDGSTTLRSPNVS